MGRYIYCDGETVWKYVFASQPSEQYRISSELGIGEYEHTYPWCDECECDGGECGCYDVSGDTLTLHQDDIGKLRKHLKECDFEQSLKEYERISDYKELRKFSVENPNFTFLCMIEAFIEFMDKRPQEQVFYFDGE